MILGRLRKPSQRKYENQTSLNKENEPDIGDTARCFRMPVESAGLQLCGRAPVPFVPTCPLLFAIPCDLLLEVDTAGHQPLLHSERIHHLQKTCWSACLEDGSASCAQATLSFQCLPAHWRMALAATSLLG